MNAELGQEPQEKDQLGSQFLCVELLKALELLFVEIFISQPAEQSLELLVEAEVVNHKIDQASIFSLITFDTFVEIVQRQQYLDQTDVLVRELVAEIKVDCGVYFKVLAVVNPPSRAYLVNERHLLHLS